MILFFFNLIILFLITIFLHLNKYNLMHHIYNSNTLNIIFLLSFSNKIQIILNNLPMHLMSFLLVIYFNLIYFILVKNPEKMIDLMIINQL
jgi:hypothetical protein